MHGPLARSYNYNYILIHSAGFSGFGYNNPSSGKPHLAIAREKAAENEGTCGRPFLNSPAASDLCSAPLSHSVRRRSHVRSWRSMRARVRGLQCLTRGRPLFFVCVRRSLAHHLLAHRCARKRHTPLKSDVSVAARHSAKTARRRLLRNKSNLRRYL